MTNFSIFEAKSRPYWVQEGISECGETGCAEGPAGAWSAQSGAETRVLALVGPWQYQSVGGRVVPGIAPLPGTHPRTHPGYYPSPPHPVRAMHRTGASAVTGVLESTKEILGVEYALGRPRARHGCVGLQPPPYAMALRPAPWRLHLTYTQYFSVFLSISQCSRILGSSIQYSVSSIQYPRPRSQISQILDIYKIF